MPTNRKRTSRTRTGLGITESDYLYYTWGTFFEAENYEEGKTKAELKAFWEKHRQAILARYFAEGRHPGQRPWPVWKWELTEPRLKVGTEEFWGGWTKNGPPAAPEIFDVMESDEEYLERLGLLEEWEKDALKKGKKLK